MVNEEGKETSIVISHSQEFPASASRDFLDALRLLRDFLGRHDLPSPSADALNRIEALHHAEVVLAHFVDRETGAATVEERAEVPALLSISRVISQLDSELRATQEVPPGTPAVMKRLEQCERLQYATLVLFGAIEVTYIVVEIAKNLL